MALLISTLWRLNAAAKILWRSWCVSENKINKFGEKKKKKCILPKPEFGCEIDGMLMSLLLTTSVV